MTDLIVEETARGRWIVKSAFNDAVLERRDSKEKAIDVARERVWYDHQRGSSSDSKVIVHLGPKKPEAIDQ